MSKNDPWEFPSGQWLGVGALTAKGPRFNPWLGSKILRVVRTKKYPNKKKKDRNDPI